MPLPALAASLLTNAGVGAGLGLLTTAIADMLSGGRAPTPEDSERIQAAQQAIVEDLERQGVPRARAEGIARAQTAKLLLEHTMADPVTAQDYIASTVGGAVGGAALGAAAKALPAAWARLRRPGGGAAPARQHDAPPAAGSPPPDPPPVPPSPSTPRPPSPTPQAGAGRTPPDETLAAVGKLQQGQPLSPREAALVQQASDDPDLAAFMGMSEGARGVFSEPLESFLQAAAKAPRAPRRTPRQPTDPADTVRSFASRSSERQAQLRELLRRLRAGETLKQSELQRLSKAANQPGVSDAIHLTPKDITQLSATMTRQQRG